ncbi:MAG: endonuclease/exonuclease/phosphatase family protein, partial [Flammeovirgaceae bacterium]
MDLSAYVSQNVYVAFIYTSTTGTNTAARWTLDDISFSNAAASYLEASPSSLSFIAGGTVKSYLLRGFNLSNTITVTAPSNFTVSKDNITFSGSISYAPAAIASAQNVFVKFDAPAGSNTFTGTITNTSTGVSTKNVSVRGTDKSQTLDITTYNLEFFGTDVKDTGGTEFGPIDDALQINNVTTVLQNISADIFAVQEVADDAAFNQLVSNLPGFSGMSANKWSYSFDPPDANFPPQKIGFIYNNSSVQLVSSRVMFSQLYDAVRAGNAGLLPGYPTTASSFWSSGRLPFMATFNVTIGGVTKRVRVVNIHAKSGSATADYNRRKYDVKVLHDSLVANYANDNIILLGDYNDDVDVSIGAPTNPESTYKIFADNTTQFNLLTLAISQTGAFSFP